MKASELRIGNIVIQGEVVRIQESSARIKYKIGEEDHISHVQYENLWPILLSEEWLPKFGFGSGMHTISNEKDICYFIINNDPLIEDFLILERKDKFYLAYDGEWGVFPMFSEIKYIHQLQNL